MGDSLINIVFINSSQNVYDWIRSTWKCESWNWNIKKKNLISELDYTKYVNHWFGYCKQCNSFNSDHLKNVNHRFGLSWKCEALNRTFLKMWFTALNYPENVKHCVMIPVETTVGLVAYIGRRHADSLHQLAHTLIEMQWGFICENAGSFSYCQCVSSITPCQEVCKSHTDNLGR